MCGLPSSPCRLVSLTVGMPNIWRGTPSTTGPNSTGSQGYATPCGSSRQLHVGPLEPSPLTAYDAVDHVMTYLFSDPGALDALQRPRRGARRWRQDALAPPDRRVHDG